MLNPRRHDRSGQGELRRRIPLNALLPNILTTLALCAGLTSVRFSLQERWPEAVTAILIAALLDALDGRVARLLKGTSRFGAELDSLSDFMSFGIAPPVLIYLWGLSNYGGYGWAAVLIFSVCMALRLARFNVMTDAPEKSLWSDRFFMGVPAPAAATLVLLPVVASFELPELGVPSFLIMAWMVLIAALMVSRWPTFSFKKVKITRDNIVFLLLAVGILATFLVTAPWLTLIALGVAYGATLPFSLRAWRRERDLLTTAR